MASYQLPVKGYIFILKYAGKSDTHKKTWNLIYNIRNKVTLTKEKKQKIKIKINQKEES